MGDDAVSGTDKCGDEAQVKMKGDIRFAEANLLPDYGVVVSKV